MVECPVPEGRKYHRAAVSSTFGNLDLKSKRKVWSGI